mgnify:CR=1 FL=1
MHNIVLHNNNNNNNININININNNNNKKEINFPKHARKILHSYTKTRDEVCYSLQTILFNNSNLVSPDTQS